MKKKPKPNIDTAFYKFWNASHERGATMHRFKTKSFYELDRAIDDLVQYAFFKGWQSRAKRDQKRRLK